MFKISSRIGGDGLTTRRLKIMADKEVWKSYPEYPFIEASNLGNMRTVDHWVKYKNGSKRLYKGHVLKQRDNGTGYMYVDVRVNGKLVKILVHRAVATCFILNPNNYPQVNHKDNDRTNNRLDNLEWCTRQYNLDYKKNFGTSPAEVLGRPVFAVNLKTGKVFWFESRAEAARQLGIGHGDISKVINGKRNTADGWWFTEDESEITEEKIQEIKANMYFFCGVIAINIETSEIFWFESQSKAARQLGVNIGNLNKVLNDRQNKTGGYWFCYADSNAIEKARAKFGNDIANKVEEFMNKHL